jgi:hypothetical protein
MARGVLTVKAVGDFSDLQKKMANTGTDMASFGKKLIAGFIGFEAIKKVAGFLVECGKAAQEDADRFAALTQVMKNQGQATGPLIDSMKDYIDNARLATGVSEDALVPALARLQAATKDVTRTQDLANVAMDIAAARGLDVTAVATALGKAQLGTVTGLQRMGVAVKDASGKTMEFDEILRGLKSTYGGTAKAIGDLNPWKRLAQAWDILKEKIGEAILPALNKMVPGITKFVVKIGDLIEAGDWAGVGTVVATSLGKAIETAMPVVLSSLGRGLGELLTDAGKAALKGYTNLFNEPNALGGVTVRKTAAQIQLALKDFDTGAEYLNTFAEAGRDATVAISGLGPQVEEVAASATRGWGVASAAMRATATSAEEAMQKAIDAATEWAGALAGIASQIDLGTMWDKAKGSLKSYNKAIQAAIESYKGFAKAGTTLEDWFGIPASAIAEIGKMPGLAQAMVKGGKDAAGQTVKGIIEVLALGGDPAAQAWLRDFGTPKATVKVTATGLGSTWADIVAYFAGKHIYIDTNLGGYAHATGYAEGTPSVPRTQMALVHQGEVIVNPANPARAQQVMQQAGLTTDNSDVVAAIERLGAKIDRLPRQYQLAARTA